MSDTSPNHVPDQRPLLRLGLKTKLGVVGGVVLHGGAHPERYYFFFDYFCEEQTPRVSLMPVDAVQDANGDLWAHLRLPKRKRKPRST